MVVVKRAKHTEEREINKSGSNSGKNIQIEEKMMDGLDLLVKRAETVVFQARTHTPFRFLQDEITICLNRVTVVDRGWGYYEEYPMPIEGINGARVVKGVMFATLHFDTFGVQKPPPLEHMSIDDARLARRYVLALIECKKNGIDLMKYPMKELREKLKQIGMVREGVDAEHNL